MDVLVTGATGYIGSAIAGALVKAGHTAHGLAHSEDANIQIHERGWLPVGGDLRRVDHLATIAARVDAVIHAGKADGDDGAMVDREATQAFLRGLAGSGKPFVYTSGVWVLGDGDSDESSPVDPTPLVAWRETLEADVLSYAPGVRAVVVRPGIVYGRNGGIVGMVASGELPVVGDGRQLWPLVHAEDLADLYVRALGAPAGAILHGVSQTTSMLDLALAAGAGRRAHRLWRQSLADARAGFGAFGEALARDQRVSSRRTRALVGWRPKAASAIEVLLTSVPLQGAA